MSPPIKIIEVGPRDGLQNEKTPVDTEKKIHFIDKLVEAGLQNIELTACVHPTAVPQMADAEAILQHFGDNSSFHSYVLVPNLKGYERLMPYRRPTVAVVVGVSDEFNLKNIRTTTQQGLANVAHVFEAAQGEGRAYRAYISTSFGCPYQGKVELSEFMDVFEAFLKIGAKEISVGDTIGVAHPEQIREWARAIRELIPDLHGVGFHLHDTYGRGLANCIAAYEEGVHIFDSSAGGLGGCPYASGASGNVATEDIVDAFGAMGVGIQGNPDAGKISEAVADLVSVLGYAPPGHLFQRWYRKLIGS